ncbi:hypothetical protein OG874_00370 [Nocardia sp. NBC_00565]|uniref:DUF6221 family protein n=1 Tax=Nocardia sp. NBC_00565 TaxID=2975993 RepID=UPI002E81085C|nr:DUF6221 family protein [Nocardia sp. NBC_00565]WUC03709.1 hypothetical protein OG874_00370 [Nocardia sp. NBC_00565]
MTASDPLARLTAGLDRDEAIAQAALRDSPIMMIRTGESEARTVMVDRGEWVAHGTTVDSYASVSFDAGRREVAAHAARQNPKATLDRVAALREAVGIAQDLIKPGEPYAAYKGERLLAALADAYTEESE